MLTPGADPVRKVSIIPRGAALGVTLSAPDDDQVSYTREDLLAKIKVALGGRVAEETVFGTISTGAESDIDQVTTIARQMVGRWGMSDAIGFVRVLPSDGRGSFLGGSRKLRGHPARPRRGGTPAHRHRPPGRDGRADPAPAATRDAGPGIAQDRDARRARRVRGSSDATPDGGRRGVRGHGPHHTTSRSTRAQLRRRGAGSNVMLPTAGRAAPLGASICAVLTGAADTRRHEPGASQIAHFRPGVIGSRHGGRNVSGHSWAGPSHSSQAAPGCAIPRSALWRLPRR